MENLEYNLCHKFFAYNDSPQNQSCAFLYPHAVETQMTLGIFANNGVKELMTAKNA